VFINNLLTNFFKIGSRHSDSENLALDKKSILMVPLIIGPVGLFWSIIYFSLGLNLSATIPLTYTLISLLSIWHFHKTKNIRVIQRMQMSCILILPFLLMWSLGGFALGSYIFIWAFFAPITALIHDKTARALYWLYAFISLIIFSTIMDQWLIKNFAHDMSQVTVEIFFFLNISVALSGIYFLIKYFIDKQDKNADEKLKTKHDALLDKTKELYDSISFLESYKTNIDNNLIVTKTDLSGTITFANENFYKTSGYSEAEVIGNKHNIVKHPDNSKLTFDALWKTILNKRTWHGRIKNRKKDGSVYWIDTTISPILNQDNEIVEFIAIRHDITKLINHQNELTHMLYEDSLTGLKNRNALQKELKVASKVSCILVNIDNFSHINNLYGEKFGNKVLVEFSTFLESSIKEELNCHVYRYGGDEFVILSSESSPRNILNKITQLIEKNEENSIIIDEQEISLSITAAISTEENHLLLSTANMALQNARENSKHILLYTSNLSLNNEYENNIKWIKEIKEAIKEDRITVYFQPIIDNSTNTINKYENLIRLIDKDGKIITPYHFLEIAKKAKLYKELTRIVIKKSFDAFKDNNYDFSINITIDDILDEEINEYIINTIKKYDISDRVIFEIVESESIENFEDIEKFIIKVKSYGCRIAIDDFGTGYSNFEHLMRLQADFIKIDGSIIKEITTDKRSALITSVIVAFAKEMNIETIGEYVESKEVNDKLIELGVNKSQGYYFDEPKASLG